MEQNDDQLNLYLVSDHGPQINGGYDCYSEFVVCAKTEQEARETHPDGMSLFDNKKNEWYYITHDGRNISYRYIKSWVKACDINSLEVKYIGTACNYINKEIVIANFNSG